MGGARVLVQVPLDRWRFSGNFGKSYVLLTSDFGDIELFVFSLVMTGLTPPHLTE